MLQIRGAKDEKRIVIRGAREHNLKNIDLELTRNKMIVVTGVSGSGKSSLVFDTIYAEGQRRYVESLSSYARQFLERMNKPDVDLILGISPAVAIEQKTGSKNPRSTVGTSTEIYDHLRLLFARIGKTICFSCGKEVVKASTGTVCDWLEAREDKSKWLLAIPIHDHEGRTIADEMNLIKRRGFFRVFAEGKIVDLNETEFTPASKKEIRIVIERFRITKGMMREKLADSIEGAFKEGENRLLIINADSGEIFEFNKFYECCGIRYEEPEPRFFSFNTPFGACPVCQGFGRVMGIDWDLVIPNHNRTIIDGAIAPFQTPKFSQWQRDLIQSANKIKFPVQMPYRDLSEEQKGQLQKGFGSFDGIDGFFQMLEEKNYKMQYRILLSRYRGYTQCSACRGSRLRREALQVQINGKNIFDLVALAIRDVSDFFQHIQLSEYDAGVASRILIELKKRLSFLNNVGLGYLTLDRVSSTLSGGETQRINLATALGSALVGTLYVLDEPSIGLHPRDTSRLISILKNLRDIGNTVLIVEHDPDMMREADILIDMGPKAGKDGGAIVFSGTYNAMIGKKTDSLTADYLAGRKQIPIPVNRRSEKAKSLMIYGARQHNLKNINIEIPLHKFVLFTGVSGSGKSTLVHEILYNSIAKHLGMSSDDIGKHDHITGIESIKHVEIVDQSPIGKTPRSNPASYIGVYELIRELFASTHQAKAKGYKPGYFSFNVAGGRCDTCQGEGSIRVEMQFLADIFLPCEDCKGTRFKKEVLDITFRGKNLVHILEMTVDEALEFFRDHNRIIRLLQTLSDVGLGYIHLGQPSNTLSGGEAQRIKLASHIALQRQTEHTLFIFDEPTTGLHYHDISKLLDCFNLLLEKKHSLVVIEHNLEVIKCADHIIDLGPEAGDLGGMIVAEGTPEQVAMNELSHTGQYLKKLLQIQE